MEKQILISISREFGSRGRDIATKLATDMGLTLYDRNILEEIAKERNVDPSHFRDVDEKPKNKFLTRRIKGHSTATEENFAHMQFDFLKERADSGESFIVLGRCSETVLKGREGLISIFITSTKKAKIKHVMQKFSLSKEDAANKIIRHDIRRKRYHNHYSDFKWGDSRHYDLCINSSHLGIDGTADILKSYIENRIDVLNK